MATVADVQTAYKAINRADLNPVVAQSVADAINNGTTSLDAFIQTQLAATTSTTQAAVAISAFVTGVTPTSVHLDALTADAVKQVASYTKMGSSNPQLGAFEAFGKAFAADASTGFAAKYGALSSTDFINSVYIQVYGAQPNAAQFASLQGQIDYFVKLYTTNGFSAADAALQAKGAVMGQIVGYAFTDANAGKAAVLDNQVASFLTSAAKGDTSTYGKALPPVLPTDSGLTFALTDKLDVLTGTAGADTFIGDSLTLQPGDTLNGGLGTDQLKLFLNAAGPFSVNSSAIEQIVIQAQANTTFNAANVKDATSVSASGNTANLTVTNLQNLVTIGVQGGAVNAAGDPTTDFTAQFKSGIGGATKTLDVSLTGGAAVNQLKVGDAAGIEDFGTVRINTTGGTGTIGWLEDGSGALSTTPTVIITGDSRTVINNVLNGTTLIDASGSTGGARVVIDTTKDVTFKGSAAADRVDVGNSGISAADVITGGDGVDILRSSQAITKADGAGITGFEVFAPRASITQDIDALVTNNPFTSVSFTNNVAATINNINTAALGNIEFTADTVTSATLTGKGFIAGGIDDTATLNFVDTATITGVDLGTLNFANVDVLNIASKSDGIVGGLGSTDVATIGSLVAADLDKITVTGDEAMSITTAAATAQLTAVDASANTGGLSLNTSGSAIAAISVVGSKSAGTLAGDTINVSNAATKATVTGGAGGDTITILVDNTSAATKLATGDTVKYVAGTDSFVGQTSGVNNFDTINGFGETTDGNKIDLSAFGFTGTQAAVIDKTAVLADVNAGTLAVSAATAANFFVDLGNVNRGVAIVDLGTDQAVYVDVNKNGALDAGDLAIKLAGTANVLAAADFTFA